jgi:UDPglucose 6-dehydrogenase
VPTPTTPNGFDASIVRSVIALVGTEKIAVIRSTVIPGTTNSIQKQYPDRIIMHSPEFLTEATAAHDAAHPKRNIIGIPIDSERYRIAAQQVLAVLPSAVYEGVMPAGEAEIVKYAGNAWLTQKIIFVNIIYDLATKLGLNYETIKGALAADPRIGSSHLNPIHASTSGIIGRGAAGHCFLKDFAALRAVYETVLPEDMAGQNILRSIEYKNVQLLTDTKKDLDLIKMVYGEKGHS